MDWREEATGAHVHTRTHLLSIPDLVSRLSLKGSVLVHVEGAETTYFGVGFPWIEEDMQLLGDTSLQVECSRIEKAGGFLLV